MTVPERLLRSPTSITDAEAFIDSAVEWAGIGFHPDLSVVSYLQQPTNREGDQCDATALDRFDQCVAECAAWLGPWITEVSYRKARSLLERKPRWRPEVGPLPATQPPARWWAAQHTHGGDGGGTTTVAYEDAHGRWWEFDPYTSLLHETHWLFLDYYFHLEGSRFRAMMPEDAVVWMKRGLGRYHDRVVHNSRENDRHALDPRAVLPWMA